MLSTDETPMWLQASILTALPQMIIGYVIACSLPKLSAKLASYPVTLAEVDQA